MRQTWRKTSTKYRSRARDAACHRAQGMMYSDCWVNQAKLPNGPLHAQEEDQLRKGYVALRAAVA